MAVVSDLPFQIAFCLQHSLAACLLAWDGPDTRPILAIEVFPAIAEGCTAGA